MALTDTRAAAETTAANKQDFRDAMSLASKRDHSGFEEHLADDVTFVNPMAGTTDRAGFHNFHEGLWKGVPDINYRVDRVIAEGETVVGECTVTGTHRGELAGVPATNKRVEIPVLFVVDYENGKAKRWVSYLDTATLLRQIGAMK